MSVYIVGAKRTAFGTFGGKLKSISATVLGTHAAKAALAAAKVDPKLVDSVVVGNVAQSSTDAPYIARHVSLYSGVPIERPAYTVNRLCGSGFQSVINAAQEIKLGESNIVIAGGAESMSQIPYSLRDARWGTRLGVDLKLEDTLWATLTDSYCKTPMAITAENLATKYGISRQQVDEYALLTQKRFDKANKAGAFKAEIAPIEVAGKKGPEQFAVDEHPRPETTIEGLTKLKPVFKKDGVVTAGTASGINDGAGAIVMASEAAVKQHGLKPLARVVSWGVAGVEPNIMGIGPVYAIRIALERAKLTLADMDLVEVNEAFAAQYLAVEKELGLDRAKTNVNGGAIAVGHPLAASGSRIVAHLTHELHRQQKRYAVGSACIGGGQGIAVVLERA